MKNAEWVGVDCHKDTIACYKGHKFREFKTTKSGYQSALKWAGNSKWALEGAYSFGRSFTAYLIKNGHEVYEVNPILTASWRRGFTVNGSKNDINDAKAIALLADNFTLQPVSLNTVKLKELVSTRKFLVKQRTEVINHLKKLSINRGEPISKVKSQKALNELTKNNDVIIRTLAEQLINLNKNIAALELEIQTELPEKAKALTILTGICTIQAATIYAELKGKPFSKKSLANYAGVAPIEKSSGKSNLHKNNKGGNRILNCVFYQISLYQSRYDEKGKAYYEKKISEGKTKRHARKCLARQLVNQVWKILSQ